MNERERIRFYVRSTRFGVLSWTSGALTVAYFAFPEYGVRLLYIALAISFVAVLPLIPGMWRARDTKLDLHNQRDRNFVLFIMCFIGLLLTATIILILYRR